MKTRIFFPLLMMAMSLSATRLSAETLVLNDGWRFAFGHAQNPMRDFGCGTEYFNYQTKAASIHNEGPYSLQFNDSAWHDVLVPHDWAQTLGVEEMASHSHGYRQIGWKYPDNSVGWYRRSLMVDSAMFAGPAWLYFDGIFRDARVWVNGFYLGGQESGYMRQLYDITPYLTLGDNNVICVRVDATLEEGWFYEGAGINRPVMLFVGTQQPFDPICANRGADYARKHYSWSPEQGFMVDGKKQMLRGVNLHADHVGVGSAVPRGLLEYRLRKLIDIGVNAIRCSHNMMSSDFLDLCDSLGLYVIEENRLMGLGKNSKDYLQNMIAYDKRHKSIILWSIGNEEWGLEWNDLGERVARAMTDYVHQLDDSRPVTVATSSGPNIIRGVDVAGYNYMMQNDIDGERKRFPGRCAYGSEETTGCGTRGVYYTNPYYGHMAAINRTDTTYVDELGQVGNVIERGWKFYVERPWLGGLFYWTGFDYAGEPNPMVYPAVSSEFGLLDNCGFMKDEAYYLQAWWTDKPTLHILPHWNLEGHEGETVDVWVYSNMDYVELKVNGRSLGKKRMPENGHLSWRTTYRPGHVEAVGYKKGRVAMTETVYTAGPAKNVVIERHTYDNITVVDLTLLDKNNHFAATACNELEVSITGSGRILGVGNGDPACHQVTPLNGYGQKAWFNAFNGHAQAVIEGEVGKLDVTLFDRIFRHID
ncbi:MAG: DUF4982 domain-containing protein [Paludibacteraceae bacterium]|nr:DUF4982 domain-containing protein [Paludibacteraceae bacterium]